MRIGGPRSSTISCVGIGIAVVCLAAATDGRSSEKELEVRRGHNLLEESATAPGVGETLDALAFRDIRGGAHYLEVLREKGPVVFAFTSTECPLAKRYTIRLKRLHERYAPRGVAFFSVHSNAEESLQTVTEYASRTEFPFPTVKDDGGYLARRLGASMTPQVFVVDRQGVLRYRGAIDDHRYEDRVKSHYLAAALEAILGERAVEAATTKTLGCTLHLPQASDIETVTYSEHVARIVQDNCQRCHRPGQVGPFSLTSYDETKRWAKEIRAYTGARLMPPWHAEPGFGEFHGDQRLTDDEISLIARWVEGGAPEGDPAVTPPAPRFIEGWELGEPDLVIEMPEEYTIAAEGEDDYRHFVIPSSFDSDRFVAAIDVKPGNRKTVHHVIVYVDNTGKARKLDARDPGPGYTRFGDPGFDAVSSLGGWAPGAEPFVYPEGTGRWLPKGTDIVLQVHYYKTGFVEKDRTKVGIYFSRAEKPRKVRWAPVINHEFVIPAGKKRHEVRADLPVPVDMELIAVFPHMHLLGKEMKVTAELPDGRVEPLIWIKNWDFNWQDDYYFKERPRVPRGTKLKLVAYFDNSSANPNNPHDPPKPVGWGEKTTDEMCIAFVSFVRAEKGAKSAAVSKKREF